MMRGTRTMSTATQTTGKVAAPSLVRAMTRWDLTALALNGMAPTCRRLLPAVAGAVIGDQINSAEHGLGIALGGTR